MGKDSIPSFSFLVAVAALVGSRALALVLFISYIVMKRGPFL
jgi:hypothetical protein